VGRRWFYFFRRPALGAILLLPLRRVCGEGMDRFGARRAESPAVGSNPIAPNRKIISTSKECRGCAIDICPVGRVTFGRLIATRTRPFGRLKNHVARTYPLRDGCKTTLGVRQLPKPAREIVPRVTTLTKAGSLAISLCARARLRFRLCDHERSAFYPAPNAAKNGKTDALRPGRSRLS